jgi:hypothetical protein
MAPIFSLGFSPSGLAANALEGLGGEVKHRSNFIDIVSNNAAFARRVVALLLDQYNGRSIRLKSTRLPLPPAPHTPLPATRPESRYRGGLHVTSAQFHDDMIAIIQAPIHRLTWTGTR